MKVKVKIAKEVSNKPEIAICLILGFIMAQSMKEEI